MSIEAANDQVWNHVKGCGVLRPRVAADIIRLAMQGRNPRVPDGLCPTTTGEPHTLTVRDCCAGWGDRAIACAAIGADYFGNDPNPELTAGYSRLSAEMMELTGKRPGFCTASLEDFLEGRETEPLDHYDVFITSPPFYDREIYRGPGQSFRGQSAAEWTRDFLVPLVDYAFKVADCVIINLENTRGADYVGAMIHHVKTTYGLEPEVYGQATGVFRPFWVWHRG